MPRSITLLAFAAAFALSGCQLRQLMCSGGMAPRTPLVTLEGTISTPESPAQAYPVGPVPLPAYPFSFARAGITGEVDVKVSVGSDGTVKEATVLKSSAAEFEEPTLLAVRQWHFLEVMLPGAAKKSGATVVCRIRFAFDES